MNTVIGKRIAKLEAALLPKQEVRVHVLLEPGPSADAETIATYLNQLAQAKRSDDRVIVVQFVGGTRLARENRDGVTYVRHGWEAQMHVLVGQPSEHGNFNRLDDLLKSLPGTVLGTVANPPRDVHFLSLGYD
jgi:hypothetical protein